MEIHMIDNALSVQKKEKNDDNKCDIAKIPLVVELSNAINLYFWMTIGLMSHLTIWYN